jgi:hypothetical protein
MLRRRAGRQRARRANHKRDAQQGARVGIDLMFDVKAISLPMENQRSELPLDHEHEGQVRFQSGDNPPPKSRSRRSRSGKY